MRNSVVFVVSVLRCYRYRYSRSAIAYCMRGAWLAPDELRTRNTFIRFSRLRSHDTYCGTLSVMTRSYPSV